MLSEDIPYCACEDCQKYAEGFGIANGSFGELLQGVLPNGRNFMVTFPVKYYSTVKFFPDITSGIVDIFPVHKSKSYKLACDLLKHFNVPIGGKLIIESEIPEGKGLASSSADLVATAYAVGQSIKKEVSKTLLSKLIRNIEPTDGIMYSGIAAFYYKEIELMEFLGGLPTLAVVAIDEGGVIDTLQYNSKPKNYSSEDMIKYRFLLDGIINAVKNKDLHEIGRISTQSAIMNQKNNHKKNLYKMLGLCEKIKGLGIAIAHSGTFIGILLDSNGDNYGEQILSFKSEFAKTQEKTYVFESI